MELGKTEGDTAHASNKAKKNHALTGGKFIHPPQKGHC